MKVKALRGGVPRLAKTPGGDVSRLGELRRQRKALESFRRALRAARASGAEVAVHGRAGRLVLRPLSHPAPAVPPYAMHLDWDPDDRIFVVTVPELSGCMTHGRTRAEAVAQGEAAIASWLGAARHWGTAIPAPAVVQFAEGLAEGEREGAF